MNAPALYIVTATAPDGRTALFAALAASEQEARDAARNDEHAGGGRGNWTFRAQRYTRKVIFLYGSET